MKTTNSILMAIVAVCVSVSAFASEPVSSKVVVLNSKSGVFKVIYTGAKPGKVSLKLTDKNGRELFSETIQSSNGFIRPMNFSDLPEGQYKIQVEDAFGKHVKELSYQNQRTVSNVRLTKLAGTTNKFLLTGVAASSAEVMVRVFDQSNQAIFEQTLKVKGTFGEVYNLSNIANGYTIEISDNRGVLETITQ